MFLPATREEMQRLGWDRADIILVTGDSYIDSPFIGVAVIGKVLCHAGHRVGIIAQPDVHSEEDISRLGEPRLFWGVTAGCVDSMVANNTSDLATYTLQQALTALLADVSRMTNHGTNQSVGVFCYHTSRFLSTQNTSGLSAQNWISFTRV
jgi:hypothetical protein